MSDEIFDSGNADLAGLGHERETPTPHGKESEGLGIGQVETDLAGTRAKQSVQKEGNRIIDAEEKILDVDVSSSTREIVSSIESIEYSGPLPLAAEMNSYDAETQAHIREMHKLQITSAIKRQERLVECVVESDRRQSDREDRLVDAEITQAASAQQKTVWINMALIIAAVITSYFGLESVALSFVGALAVVNVATLFIPLRGRKKKDESEKKEKEV